MHGFQQFQPRLLIWLLFASVTWPTAAHAIEIGEAYVESEQNQPLNARINVSDIDPTKFSVNLANSQAYRQLGLKEDNDLMIRFEPTSSNGGVIVLTSRQPIVTPYADVLLNLNNGGQSRLLPKTLLLPLDSKQRATPQSLASLIEPLPNTIVVGNAANVQLPAMNQPLVIQQSLPPPLPMADGSVMVGNTLHNLPETSSSDNLTMAQNQDILPTVDASPTEMSDTLTAQASTLSDNADDAQSNTFNLKVPPERPYSADTSAASLSANNVNNETTDSASGDSPTTYVVERNDNLWTIASELAKQHNADINTIMQSIVEANPQAFADNDPSQLYANTTLTIPTFETRPSKRSIQAANRARGQHKKNTKTSTKSNMNAASNRRSTTKSDTQAHSSQRANTRKQRMARTANQQALAAQSRSATRRTEMTIITPSQQQGAAQGGVNQTAGGSNVNSALVTQVKAKRQSTAQQARTVGQLNQNLVRAENRLQIQNARLAQLEKRLKELNQTP